MYKREVTVGQNVLSIETGKLAKQANGSVVVRYGDTVVLVTACYNHAERKGIDFLPLTVDYREYTYASGRIPGGFFKREGKPAEKEVLTSRAIDRPLRPLFPSGWRHETQVVALVLSADSDNDSDVLAITGAGAALALSEIPVEKTIAAVRVALLGDEVVINPTYAQRKEARLDIVVAGSKDGLVMVEAGAKVVSEELVVNALEAGHAAIKQIVDMIDRMAKEAGKAKVEVKKKEISRDFYREVEEKVLLPLGEAMQLQDKIESYAAVDQILEELVGSMPEEEVERRSEAKAIFKELKEKVLRDAILDRGVRLDGRAFDQVRPISDRGGRAAARARVGRLHPRRDAGARHRHARHCRRPAEGRDGERRDLQALHAALQLPAVLGGRGGLPARPGPPRGRTRGARRAVAGADAAGRGEVPLHRARRLGHPRVERVVVDGHRVRRVAGPDGRRACRWRRRSRAWRWAW